MDTEFFKKFADLCDFGDRGTISDFIVSADQYVSFIKDDENVRTELMCSKEDFAEMEAQFNRTDRDDAKSGNYDASWVFKRWRFRINGFLTQGRSRVVMRLLPDGILPVEKLGLPDEVIEKIEGLEYGLVLVCGATGSGKSTTISSLVDHMSRIKPSHTITLEDPIEYIIGEGSDSIISQRQVGVDVPDFASGLRAALRQKPNVIFVGEIRDAETAATALNAANTGHIVFSTLHTGRAAESIERFLEMIPPEQATYSVGILADALQVVVCQKLLKSTNGGRVPIFEVYNKFPAVVNSIRHGKFNAIKDLISLGTSNGCLELQKSYANAVSRGLVIDQDLDFS